MVVETFNSPTREQLSRVSQGDERLLRAFEEVFRASGRQIPDSLSEIEADIAGILATPNALTRALSELKGKQTAIRSLELGQLVFVSDRHDFPTAVGGVITLVESVAYCLTGPVDLQGDRIVSVVGNTLCGTDQTTDILRSTGLIGTALITSNEIIMLRDIGISDVDIALDLTATNPFDFLVWISVQFESCATVGNISNYSSVVMSFCGISNSANLTFDGTIGTVGLSDMFISGIAGQTTISLLPTAIITRRFRIRFSSLITPATATALDISTSATIPDESYLLLDCNFSGAGTRTSGVQFDDNKSMFTANIGIQNSRTFAQYFMTNNAVTTPVIVSTPTKALGATTSNPISQRFSFTDNRATYTGAITRDFEVEAWSSLSSNNNNVLRLYIAKNGVAITTTFAEGTANAGGRAEGLVTASVVEMETNDFLEVFVSNETGGNNVLDINLNVIVSEL